MQSWNPYIASSSASVTRRAVHAPVEFWNGIANLWFVKVLNTSGSGSMDRPSGLKIGTYPDVVGCSDTGWMQATSMGCLVLMPVSDIASLGIIMGQAFASVFTATSK